MSKTEIWRNAARTATEQQRQAVKSTAEAQRQLAEQIELIAESLKLLSDENQRTQSEMREQFQATADLAQRRIEEQVNRTRHVGDWLEQVRSDAGEALAQIERQSRRLQWQGLAASALIGLLIVVLSLTALAIWQPTLLVGAWQVAQALGTAPVQ